MNNLSQAAARNEHVTKRGPQMRTKAEEGDFLLEPSRGLTVCFTTKNDHARLAGRVNVTALSAKAGRVNVTAFSSYVLVT
eukprot:8029341-Pyramimonas_sp.AAC.1